MNQYEQLDTVLEEIIARWGLPGLGIGIVKDGEIVKGAGSACRAWIPALR